MKRGRDSHSLLLAALVAVIQIAGVLVIPAVAFAQQAISPSYQVNEAFFGTGGQLCDPTATVPTGTSTNYCAKSAAGETVVGNSASTNYQAQGGFNTNREEFIEFKVANTSTDLGVLLPGTPATTTGTFSVKTYLAGSYVVVNGSNPPQSGANFLNNLTSPTASSPGSEQFGINLVANTSPVSFGSAPTQSPDSTFGFGNAATGYNTANQYKYVKGDTIASSAKSSGTTNYTISYLYNISTSTKAGLYTFNHVLIATSTF